MLNRILPHGIIIICFYAITAWLFKPMIFDGKDFYQHDIQQSTGKNQSIKQYQKDTGEQALWNNSMFSGSPEYFATYYPENIFRPIARVLTFGFRAVPAKVFYALIGAYIMLLLFKVRPLFAAMGAITFALCGHNIIGLVAGHNSRIQAIAFLPIILGGVYYSLEKDKWIGSLVVLLGLGLQIRANHLQITYYTLLILVVAGLVYLIYALREKTLPDFMKTIGLLCIAAIIAVGANFGKLWSMYEYSQYSTRGKNDLEVAGEKKSGLDKNYAFQYSNGIIEPLVLFVPHILGGSSSEELDLDSNVGEALTAAGYNRLQAKQQLSNVPTYWGDQPLTAPYYLSIVALLFLGLSYFYLNRKEKIWLYTVIIFGIVLSWGSNFSGFNNLVFDYLPGYNKFRSVTFAILLPIIGIIVASYLSLERFIKDEDSGKAKKLLTATAITAGFCLFLLLIANFLSFRGSIDEQLPEWYASALRDDRKALLIQDLIKAIFIILLVAGVLYAKVKNKIQPKLALALIAVVVLAEMILATTNYINEDKFAVNSMKQGFSPTEADKLILNSGQSGRVLNLQNPFNESLTSYFHESLGGYHGAKMGRYNQVIEYHLHPEISELIEGLRNQKVDFSNARMINMLNASFVKFGNEANMVIPNPDALGPAWLVQKLNPVMSASEEIAAIKTLDVKTEAVYDASKFSLDRTDFGPGTIELLNRDNNSLSYRTESQQDIFAVFSEIYYPKGWKITIDGQPASMVQVNYTLRGMEIPAGSHEIKFNFRPSSYYTGRKISLASSFLVVGFIGLTLFIRRKPLMSVLKSAQS